MKKYKRKIFLSILVIAIGSAAVATSLFFNGGVNIGVNVDDFDIYFSKVKENNEENDDVIVDDKNIMFDYEFKHVGDSKTIEYYITNGSSQYDANVNIDCNITENNYLSFTNTWVNGTIIEAKDTMSGELQLELINPSVGDVAVENEIECTIVVTAVSRNSINDSEADMKKSDTKDLSKKIKYLSEDIDIDFGYHSSTLGHETNGIYKTTSTDDGKPIYYYRGDVNNNLIFNNTCWKIVRTTETGGIKLLYNGVTRDNYEDVNLDEYNYTTSYDPISYLNTSSNEYPFIYDNSTNTWNINTSNDYGSKFLSSLEIENLEEGEYYLDFDLNVGYDSSSGDDLKIYLDGELLTRYTGTMTSKYYLGKLKSTSKILVKLSIGSKSHPRDGWWGAPLDNAGVSIKLVRGVGNVSKCTATYAESELGRFTFNDKVHGDNRAAGYMYGTYSTSYDEIHANINDSEIKEYVDDWYQKTFIDEDIISKIDDVVYCNDRSVGEYQLSNVPSDDYPDLDEYKLTHPLGTVNAGTIYNTLLRTEEEHSNPTLKCIQPNDRFTVSSERGNGALTYPVGLLSLDEAVFGGFNTDFSHTEEDNISINYGRYRLDRNNTRTYLHSGLEYWLMSPEAIQSLEEEMCVYTVLNHVDGLEVDLQDSGVRPVIALKASALQNVEGKGTKTEPYIVR